MGDPTRDLPHAHGGPAGTALAKAFPEDFVVEELLGFEPSGEGEHVFLRIEKRGENTEYVARRLARFAGVPIRNVGYAGLKDRHGRTIQWYSVQLPGQAGPDWRELESDSLRILDLARNQRKLRKGANLGNRFAITLREVQADPGLLECRLNQISAHGVPNYFGAQRFGHDGQNLDRAQALFAGSEGQPTPHQRSLYLSAARSEIFNRILALRVAGATWNRAIPGDAFMFQGSRSFFKPESLTEEILRRVEAREIHPSGTLWGTETPVVTDEAAALEQTAVAGRQDFCRGLERFGIETARRPLRVCPEDLRWNFEDPEALSVQFALPAGAYATAVLREVLTTGFTDT